MEKNNNLLNISSNNYNNNNCFIKRKYLNYIAFIKFWAMLLIIKWHIIPYKIIKIDYGARMCEILFISSGFLIGYNVLQEIEIIIKGQCHQHIILLLNMFISI